MLLPTPLCTVFALTFIFRKICHVGIVYEGLLFELHLLWVQQLSGVYVDHHSSERTAALLFNQHTIKGKTLYFVSQKERAVYHGEGSMAAKHSWSPTEGAKLLLVAWCHLGRSNLYNTQALPHDRPRLPVASPPKCPTTFHARGPRVQMVGVILHPHTTVSMLVTFCCWDKAP